MLPQLIEPSDLLPHLSDDALIIVDLCREENYARHHIPGAVHINPAQLISGRAPAVGKLPPIEQLNALFSHIGYDKKYHIVAYDDEGGGWAGRFIWTLEVIGHHNWSYLNGGLIAWANEGHPLTAEHTDRAPRPANLLIDTSVVAELQDVLQSIDDHDTLVWDARSPEEYNGTMIAAARGGHIPGAINLDWLELMDPQNNLRLRTNLQEIVAEHGFTRAKSIITHCQTHHRSGLTYLVGRLLDLPIKAYHGSWSEWGNDPSTPIVNSADLR